MPSGWTWTPTARRSAGDINFENLVREREAQAEARLLSPRVGTVNLAPGWDTFYGGLRRTSDDAADRGMTARVNWSGFGNSVGSSDMPQRTSATGVLPSGGTAAIDRELALNDYLSELQDRKRTSDLEYRQRLAATHGAEDAARAGSVAASGPLDLDRAAGMAKTTPGFDALTVDEQRKRIMDLTPYHLRPALEKSFEDQSLNRSQQELRERQQTETERHNKAVEDMSVGAMLSDDAIEQTAKRYLETGVMPPLGMGDKTTRQRVLNKAAELGGAGANVAGNSASFAADRGSLVKMQAQRDAIGAFEETAKKNMDVFLKAAEKVVDTGSPLLNQPARMVTGKMLGSPDQAAYEAARNVLLPEIARIIVNPNLTGVLSDSAREEISSFNPENATLGQTVRVMKLLKQDMDNRTKSLDDQIANIRGRIGNSQKTEKSGGDTVDMVAPDGRPLRVPASKVAELEAHGAKRR